MVEGRQDKAIGCWLLTSVRSIAAAAVAVVAVAGWDLVDDSFRCMWWPERLASGQGISGSDPKQDCEAAECQSVVPKEPRPPELDQDFRLVEDTDFHKVHFLSSLLIVNKEEN